MPQCQDAAAPDAHRPAPPRYAPVLPPTVLHAILLPLAGDIATLCAAACVSTNWHVAALHPRLWKKLELHPPLYATAPGADTSCQSTKPQHLTDERLAMLVRRACGLDAKGNVHKLLSLRATHSTEVTLRGVLAALRGPRTLSGKPLLRGALRTLHVSGVKHCFSKPSGKLVAALFKFVAVDGDARPNFDILGAGITACTKQLPDGTVCGRVASALDHACDKCGIALCAGCCRSSDAACEHMCSSCGRVADELELCACCEDKGQPASFCSGCMWHCAGNGDDCDDRDDTFGEICQKCAEKAIADGLSDVTTCKGCGSSCCGNCTFESGNMSLCMNDAYGLGCCACYCPKPACAGKNLTMFWTMGDFDDEPEVCYMCRTCRREVQPSVAALRKELRLRYPYHRSPSPIDSGDDDDDELLR